MHNSIGTIEFRSISKGIEVSDFMVKKAQVEIIYFKMVCPGKFVVIVSGNEDEVKEAIDYGVELGNNQIVDSFIVNAVHEDIINGLKNKYKEKNKGAYGIVEINSICSGIKALDRMLKEANVTLVKIQLAFAIGGKFVFIVSGEVSDIEGGVRAVKEAISEKRIINISIIPSPDPMIISMLT